MRRSACSMSRWLATDTYSPTAIDSAPAASPAMPAVRTADVPTRRRRRRPRSGRRWTPRRRWRRAPRPAATRPGSTGAARRAGAPTWWCGRGAWIDHRLQPATGRFAADATLVARPRRGGRRRRPRRRRGPPRTGRPAVAAREHGAPRSTAPSRSTIAAAASAGRPTRRCSPRCASVADVVLVGAGTARAEGYGPPQALRRRPGRPRAPVARREVPRLAVVTRSLDLDPAAPLFTDAEQPTIRDHLRGRADRTAQAALGRGGRAPRRRRRRGRPVGRAGARCARRAPRSSRARAAHA